MEKQIDPPLILAPAGNKDSFLAALAAGADAIYCGLKSLSARMEAKNFSIAELIPLTELAHEKGVKIYITFNSLLKNGDIEKARFLIKQLAIYVKPDALIVQDLSVIQLARETGWSKEIHMSTLSNVSFPAALSLIKKELGVNRVVIPRELNVDEIKQMADACPEGLDLELFVHGALCYGVSGRCYWSSYLGGKSGLRGRCVQPCRRLYVQNGQRGKYFSCRDLSLDLLVKILLPVPQIRIWKIEGRKKGPHYVYYTVTAYKMLRDHGKNPKIKKAALQLLDMALGRPVTRFNFLPQRNQDPVKISGQTGSGLFIGKITGSRHDACLVPRKELLNGDILRIGYEGEFFHAVKKVTRYVPKKGRLHINIDADKKYIKGIPVFLIDRREKVLAEKLSVLEQELEKNRRKLPELQDPPFQSIREFRPAVKLKKQYKEISIYRYQGKQRIDQHTGLWLSANTLKLKKSLFADVWWWLPPVIWPEDEKKLLEQILYAINKGSRNFVLNAPWQKVFFSSKKRLNLWAGPFCNIANGLSIKTLAALGFAGVIVSPELGKKDYRHLPEKSPLPLGIVLSGAWPFSISRILSTNLETDKPIISPRGEICWTRQYGSDQWIYPNWKIDLTKKRNILSKAGYTMFINIFEPTPKDIEIKRRKGIWNWDIGLP
jgi:putative protease